MPLKGERERKALPGDKEVSQLSEDGLQVAVEWRILEA